MVSTMTSVEPMKIPEGYKQTEVGVIPEDWKVEAIKDVYEICNTLRLPLSSSVREGMQGKYPYYGPTKIQDYLNEYRVEGKYALIGEDGDHFLKYKVMPQTQLASGRFNVNNHAHLIKGRVNLTEWFYFYFKNRDISVYLTRQGAGRYKLSKGALEVLPCAVPSVSEQKEITSVLSDVDNLIASLETLIAKKSAIKTAAMQQLLTGKKRLPGFVKESEKQGSDQLAGSGSTNQATQSKASNISDSLTKSTGQTTPRPDCKETELGEIPEDWEVRKLGDLVSITSGESPSKFIFSDSGIPYFKVEQLNNHKKYAEITEYYLKASNSVEQGSIVFPKRGASILLNKIRIFKRSSFMDTNLMALTCSDDLSHEYLFYFLNYKGLDSVADTTSIPQINNKHITPFLVPLMKIEEQTAIASVLSDMDTELDALQQRLNKTKKIKQGMMQELLTGKTRLV